MRAEDRNPVERPMDLGIRRQRADRRAGMGLEQTATEGQQPPLLHEGAAGLAARPVRVGFTHVAPGPYRFAVRRTGFRSNDAYTAYLEMGAPKDLNPAQLRELQRLTRDALESERSVRVERDGNFSVRLPMRANDIVLVTLDRTSR